MIFENIKQNIKSILKNKPTIVLGLSGGPDSVFLFHFLKKLHAEDKIELICAHLDHGWRKESALDAKFCQDLCRNNQIPFFITHAQDLGLDLKFNGSKEATGRKLRRHFLEKVLIEQNANFIALAHHLQDQQETFFWRIIRGSTLSGLSCMKQLNGVYFRPLLNTSKQEILDYLHKNKIEYLSDHTNDSDAHLRNRIRKYVLPALQQSDKRFDQKFESTLKHLQEEDNFLKSLTEEIFNQVFKKAKNHTKNFIANLNAFLELPPVLQKRLLIYWLVKEKIVFNPSNSYLEEILKFLSSQQGGSHQLGQNWLLHKKQKSFWIEKI